jgi:transposase-like protein
MIKERCAMTAPKSMDPAQFLREQAASADPEMATYLDAQVEAFRNRPLDGGPYTFVWLDALTIKVREAGRTVNVHALVAVGVNGG